MKFVKVTTERVGYHRWLQAPSEVKFLRAYHKHIFKLTVTVEEDEDRGIEFFSLQNDVNKIIDLWIERSDYPMVDDFGWEDFYLETGVGIDQDVLVIGSCEDFAGWIANSLAETYKHVTVEVSEDGENSGICVL